MLSWLYLLVSLLICTVCEEVDKNSERTVMSESRLSHYKAKTGTTGVINNDEMLFKDLELLLNNFKRHVVVKRSRRDCSLDEGYYKENQRQRCIHYIRTLMQSIIVREPRSADTVVRVLREISLPICLNGTNAVYVNLNHSICCNGSVVDREQHFDCCSDKMIDTRTHFCCNDIEYERKQHQECCGKYQYDPQKYDCCSDTLIDLKNHACCNESLQLSGECCNSTYLSGTCITCENNKVDKQYINPSTQLCCGGKVKTRKHICNINSLTEDEAIVQDRSRRILPGNNDSVMMYQLIGAGCGVLVVIGSSCSIFYCLCNGNFKYIRLRGEKDCAKGDSEKCISQNITEINATDIDTVQNNGLNESNSCLTPDDQNVPCREDQVLLINTNRTEVTTEAPKNIDGEANSTNVDMPTVDVKPLNSKLLKDLEKDTFLGKGNLTTDHFQNSQTQTDANNDKYKRNIFGEQFEETYIFDESNTTLRMEDSDAQLTLPGCMIKNGTSIEVFASTFRDIQAMTDKLDLPDNKSIASPAVEYWLATEKNLEGFACVRLPFVGKPENLTVLKFESDEGLNAHAKTVNIPLKDKQNDDLDLFYSVEGKTVLIYTRSFSGFVCITCKCRRDLELVAFLFGSYKRVNDKYEVRIRVYVADILYAINDYKKEILDDETENKKRKCLERDFQLELPGCDLDGNDYIKACFTHKERTTVWQHDIHPRTGNPTFEEIQIIKLSSVAKECKTCSRHHTSYKRSVASKDWYLHTVQNAVPKPDFQCYINLDVCKKDREIYTINSIPVDNLSICENDRIVRKANIDSKPVQETRARDTQPEPTLVRAESEQSITTLYGRRSVMPGPELSQRPETMRHQALLGPLIDRPTANESNNGS